MTRRGLFGVLAGAVFAKPLAKIALQAVQEIADEQAIWDYVTLTNRHAVEALMNGYDAEILKRSRTRIPFVPLSVSDDEGWERNPAYAANRPSLTAVS